MFNQRRRKAPLLHQENNHEALPLGNEDDASFLLTSNNNNNNNNNNQATMSSSKYRVNNKRSMSFCRYAIKYSLLLVLLAYLGLIAHWVLRTHQLLDYTTEGISTIEHMISTDTPTDPEKKLHSFTSSPVIPQEKQQQEQPLVLISNSTLEQQAILPISQLLSSDHRHAIPNVVIFTHYVNLLHNLTALRAKFDKEEFQELLMLQQNVKRIVQLHPRAQVRFLTDTECIQSIQSMFGPNEKNQSRLLVHYFRNERAGMYKADLCRGAALYETGGLYFDVDLGARMNIFEALRKKTTFSTIKVHRQSNRPNAFFQAFMGVTPKHPVIDKYVRLFLDFYQGKLPEFKGEPLGVVLLKRALDDVLQMDSNVGKSIELWQEVLYRPEMKKILGARVPYPTWGTRRACKFIVMVHEKDPTTTLVPFYSRIAGSRMCPVKKSKPKVNKDDHVTTSKRQL
jgi:mannosyltransferase OCH1-like enzyme